MPFGRSDEKAAQHDQAAHANTPLGRAELARSRGDGFFQVEIDINQLSGSTSMFSGAQARVHKTGGRPDLLGQIEEAGWRLEHVGYVFIETGSVSTNRMLGTGQKEVTRGMVRGIYLFRSV